MKTNRQEVFPDAVHLSNVLNPAEQQELASQCLALGQDPAGFYTPRLRNGSAMRLKMLCLGRHWNPQTYRYEAYRSDHDQRAAPPLPQISLNSQAGSPSSPAWKWSPTSASSTGTTTLEDSASTRTRTRVAAR